MAPMRVSRALDAEPASAATATCARRDPFRTDDDALRERARVPRGVARASGAPRRVGASAAMAVILGCSDASASGVASACPRM